MMPFDKYPSGGLELLGFRKGSNCRHDYGLEFMRSTGETCCAYCGIDFTSDYQVWLSMVLDHVVPRSVCIFLNLPEEWSEDLSNFVLACGACNGFCNRYRHKPPPEFSTIDTITDFFNLRNRVFRERKVLIAKKHEDERAFFEQEQWKKRSSATASPQY